MEKYRVIQGHWVEAQNNLEGKYQDSLEERRLLEKRRMDVRERASGRAPGRKKVM